MSAVLRERWKETVRERALAAMYESVMDRVKIPYPEFLALLGCWEAFPIIDQGQIIGALVRRGNELHLGVNRRPRTLATRYLRAVLANTIAHYGYATTKVGKDNPAGVAFCRRLGFETFDEDAKTWYLRCDKPRYRAKGAP